MDTTDPVQEDKAAAAAAAQKNFTNPYDFLATLPEAPSKAMIDSWKAQAPNHRLRIFAPSASRVFILRAIGGLELQKLQSLLPQNLGAGLAPEQAAAKIEFETQCLIGAPKVIRFRPSRSADPVPRPPAPVPGSPLRCQPGLVRDHITPSVHRPSRAPNPGRRENVLRLLGASTGRESESAPRSCRQPIPLPSEGRS